jgi:DNA helicase-2/ATP-dependent DNA helicase PcrA
LLSGKNRLTYDHLVLDEVQDMSPLAVGVLLDTMGRGRPITLAGDTAQRIVKESGFVSWDCLFEELGLSERQVATLQVAYRSTAEIMEFSRYILGPLAEQSPQLPRSGASVEIHRFTDPGQAVDFLGAALRDLALREPRANVALITRYATQASLYHEGLLKAEVPGLRLVLSEDFTFRPGCEVTEVRQVKGLEFDYVILLDVNADSYPETEDSRRLLHLGATRAAHQLWLVCTGPPSPLLPCRLDPQS